MKNKLTVHYRIKTRQSKKGENTTCILCNLAYNGNKISISTGIKIPQNAWLSACESVIYNENTKQQHQALEKFKKRVDECKLLMEENGEEMALPTLKNYIFKIEKKITFGDLREKVIAHYRTLLEQKTINIASIKQVKQYTAKFRDFLKSESKTEKDIRHINQKDANLFCEYLEKYTTLSQNTRRKNIQGMKHYFKLACKWEIIVKNPFEFCEIPKLKNSPLVFLTAQELNILQKANFHSESLNQVKDLFLFQCFTGLAYADLAKVVKGEHELLEQSEDANFKFWIKGERQKSGSSFIIPILPEALGVIQKYGGVTKLPLITNQKYNKYLKEVSELLNFKHNLTTHIGRKTFGFYALNKGASYEVVAKVLGHSTISTTQKYYAKVLDNRVSEEMSAVREKTKSTIITHITQEDKKLFSQFQNMNFPK